MPFSVILNLQQLRHARDATRRDAARALSDLWVNAIAVARQRALWAEQLGFAEASRKAVETRRRAGDASVLDVNVARADLTEVQRQLSSPRRRRPKPRRSLRHDFRR